MDDPSQETIHSCVMAQILDNEKNITINKLKVSTWNIGGIMLNTQHLQNCLMNSDICVLQEHWLYPDSLDFLCSVNKHFTGWGRSSNDLNLNSIWRRGKGGIGMLWRKSLDASITKLENLGNDRILVIQLRLANEKMVFIIGAYLPATNLPIHQFRRYLEDLENVVNHLYDQGTLLILGDFNSHIGTHGGPRSLPAINHSGLDLINVIERMNLLSANSQNFCRGPVATYFASQGTISTTTDHIFMKKETVELVTDCHVQDENSTNLSYHVPIFCSFNFDIILKQPKFTRKLPNLSWKLMNNDKIAKRYQKNVGKSLVLIGDLTISNLDELEYATSKFTEAMTISANKSIPRAKPKPYLKPYWNKNLSELHKETRRCRNEWIKNGKQRSREDIFFINYKESKRKFRKLLRIKFLEHELKENEQMQKTFEVDRNKFQSTISKKRKTNSRNGNILKIDGRLIDDEDEVLEVWRNHYKDLYAPAENDDFDEPFRKQVEQKINEYSLESHYCHDDPLESSITVEEVRENCLKLPNGKAGGPDGLLYEHLKYAGDSAYVYLTRIFNAIRELEDVPDSSATGVIISLFKGKKKSKYSKDNYRGITLLNVVGKLFERIILNRSMPFFEKSGFPNELQFAYQKSRSSIFASFVLQESTLDAIENGSKIYSCFLDSAKAFDTVWVDGLFFKLFNLGIQGKTWRMLKKWYEKMTCCVANNGRVSAPFPVKQGVRQGGVLSPWLFMCFNNDITKEMRDTNCGIVTCSSIFCGNVNVADDVALISPRVSGLQSMILAMEQYSKKWRFTFNVSKTTTITFGESIVANIKNKEKRNWILDNQPIEEKSTCEHVGMTLSADLSSSTRTKEAVNKGNEVVSALMSVGMRPGGLNPICGIELWKSVGLSKMLYGSELWWNITKTDLNAMERVNRSAAKRSQGLCYMTRSEAAIGNLGLWTVEGYIDKKKLLFLQKLIHSETNTIHKQIFIKRLFNFLNGTVDHPQGYIPDILKILNKYNLNSYLDIYLNNGYFPNKCNWKNIVKKKVQRLQTDMWREGILTKPELKLYSLVHNDLKVLELWHVAFRHPLFLKAIANMVNILCGNIPSEVMSAVDGSNMEYNCKHCRKSLSDISYHFIMDCPVTVVERTKLWDLLQDRLPTDVCAQLFNSEDEVIYCNFFSSEITNTLNRQNKNANNKEEMKDTFLLTLSHGILKILNKVACLTNS